MDKKKFIIISSIVIIAIGVGALVYFMAMGGKNDGASSTSDTTGSTANKTQSTAANTEVRHACELVTKADVDKSFGLTFIEGLREKTGNPDRTSCKYNEQNDNSPTALMKAVNFSIEAQSFATAQAAQASMKTTRSTDKIGDKVLFVVTDVPGVGDEAFFFQGQAPGILKTEEYMYARKGRAVYHFIAVKLDGIDHEKAKIQLTQIAKKALNEK